MFKEFLIIYTLKMRQKIDLYNGKMILSIDYGKKVTGLAHYTPGREPFPLGYGRIIYQSDEDLIKQLSEIISNESIEILVLGLPLFTDGTESEMTKTVRNFGKKLQEAFDKILFFFQDETLTTYEAKERMKNSPKYNFKIDLKKIDELSAVIILEDFMRN